MRLVTRGALIRLASAGAVLVVAGTLFWWFVLRMPGENYAGPPAPAGADLVAELKRDVAKLAGEIGDRNVYQPEAFAAAARWLEGELTAAGYAPERQTFRVKDVPCVNLVATVPGDGEIVVVGAHYDSVFGCPAANDNGSGVAATLALARRCRSWTPRRTLRFVFFANEEPPWFQTDDMGSLVYARACEQRGDDIVAMLSLETIGYFTDAPDSQDYPFEPLRMAYGDRGNFVAFVGNLGSIGLVRRCLKTFRAGARIPSHGIALMEAVPGIDWSDHWSFWQCGYDAIMVTDTAPYRYPHYHEETDTPEKLKYEELAAVVEGLLPVVRELGE